MRLSRQFQFFLRTNFVRTKTQFKQKPTNKTKTSKQKTAKATVFRAQNILRGVKLFILHFLKKIKIVLITSFIILLYYAVSTLPLSNDFSLSMGIHKTLWPDRQDKRQVTYETFKNASSKPVRDRFHGCGTLTSKEALGT